MLDRNNPEFNRIRSGRETGLENIYESIQGVMVVPDEEMVIDPSSVPETDPMSYLTGGSKNVPNLAPNTTLSTGSGGSAQGIMDKIIGVCTQLRSVSDDKLNPERLEGIYQEIAEVLNCTCSSEPEQQGMFNTGAEDAYNDYEQL